MTGLPDYVPQPSGTHDHLLHGQNKRLWPGVSVGVALPYGRLSCGVPEPGHCVGVVQHEVPIGLWDQED